MLRQWVVHATYYASLKGVVMSNAQRQEEDLYTSKDLGITPDVPTNANPTLGRWLR